MLEHVGFITLRAIHSTIKAQTVQYLARQGKLAAASYWISLLGEVLGCLAASFVTIRW